MMQKFSVVLGLLFLNLSIVSGTYIPRQAAGTQFITGPCQSDSDCALGCCGFNTGKCAGPVVALERDGGCGFGDAQPNGNAAAALRGAPVAVPVNNGAAAAAPAAAAPAVVGTQFITGDCANDAACASGCCALRTGKCAARLVALETGGCGFGGAAAPAPINNAGAAPAPAPAAAAPAVVGTQFITGDCANDAACASGCCALRTGKCAARLVALETGGCGFGGAVSPAPVNNAGAAAPAAPAAAPARAPGTQFITGPCTSDADCANGCCGFNTGKCAGAIVALERDGGCGFGDAQPNDNAAQALRARRR